MFCNDIIERCFEVAATKYSNASLCFFHIKEILRDFKY
jgi:hypothetical protein